MILHCGFEEQPGYVFDDEEVVRYLEGLSARDRRYGPLLALRQECRDGADFPKEIMKRCEA